MQSKEYRGHKQRLWYIWYQRKFSVFLSAVLALLSFLQLKRIFPQKMFKRIIEAKNNTQFKAAVQIIHHVTCIIYTSSKYVFKILEKIQIHPLPNWPLRQITIPELDATTEMIKTKRNIFQTQVSNLQVIYEST